MNAPPISEATFMVEEARSAMLDPEADDLICATTNRADNPAKMKTSSAIKAAKYNLI